MAAIAANPRFAALRAAAARGGAQDGGLSSDDKLLFQSSKKPSEVRAFISAFFSAGLGALAVQDLDTYLEAIIEYAPSDLIKNVFVTHIPTYKEMMMRNMYANLNVNTPITDSSWGELFVSEGYSKLPQYKVDQMFELPSYKIDKKDNDAWDKEVKEIIDLLTSEVSSDGLTVFGEKNQVTSPGLVTVTSLNRAPLNVQNAIFRKRSPPYGMDGIGASNYAKGRLFVSAQNGGKMQGGHSSAHAPLYPRLVMNGGSHPLAVLEGGGSWEDAEGSKFDPVSQLTSKINRLKAVFKSLKGDETQLANLDDYKDTIDKALRELRTKLWELNNVNTALASGKLSSSVDFNFADLAQKGKEINEKATKVSKGYVNLAAIAEHLEELVNRMRPAALKGGLHDALKY